MIVLNLSACSSRHLEICIPQASVSGLHCIVRALTHCKSNDYFLLLDGRPSYSGDEIIFSGNVEVALKLPGGKGGFGSMLRAIGAQIEKTTNREACRDLSGRRLRDINEEQRLKNWISQQREREKEAEERHKKKLEKLAAEPKHEFSDEKYEQDRLAMTEKLYESVEQGLVATLKRPMDESTKVPPKKKVKKFLLCSDEELSSSDESDADKSESCGQTDNSDIILAEIEKPVTSNTDNQMVKGS